jgi:hypothetical protein
MLLMLCQVQMPSHAPDIVLHDICRTLVLWHWVVGLGLACGVGCPAAAAAASAPLRRPARPATPTKTLAQALVHARPVAAFASMTAAQTGWGRSKTVSPTLAVRCLPTNRACVRLEKVVAAAVVLRGSRQVCLALWEQATNEAGGTARSSLGQARRRSPARRHGCWLWAPS